MRLKGNEIAATIVIALGVGGVLAGSLLGKGSLEANLTGLMAAPTATPAPVQTPAPAPEPTPEPEPVVETVRFSASGDNLIHEGLYLQARERGGDHYDFTYAYENLRDFYAGFDINWLNQETLVNDAYAPSGYPQFSTPTDITNALLDIGFRVFSLSNNHSYDKGADGIASSLAHWNSLPEDVYAMGFYNKETHDEYVYQTVNGITFGYLSYTEYTNGIPTPSAGDYSIVYLEETDIIQQQIAAMRPNCDVLVVSCHWGEEGSHNANTFQQETAQWLADQGVDMIIGTHPHVTQDAQWLTGASGNPCFVTYSLGNFISAQASADNMIGTLLDVTFQKTTNPDGSVQIEIVNPVLRPVITQYESGYNNIRVYLYRDYTEELGAEHGNFDLSRAYIEEVLQNSVSPEFLVLD